MTARIDVPTLAVTAVRGDGEGAQARPRPSSSATFSGAMNESPQKTSPVKRAFLTALKCLGFGCIAILSLGFSAYIFLKFLARPVDQWVSVSNYGKTTGSAAFISGHWVGGVLVSVCGLVQIVPFIRRKYPRVHRYSGRVYILGALSASVFGMLYIVFIGTVGGPTMDIAFAIYGVLLFCSALLTVLYARKRLFDEHRRWAVRTFALSTASAMYRLYVMPLFVNAFTDESSSTTSWSHEHRILYLNVAAWMFYPPSLAIAEIFIWRSWGYGSRSDAARKGRAVSTGRRREFEMQPATRGEQAA